MPRVSLLLYTLFIVIWPFHTHAQPTILSLQSRTPLAKIHVDVNDVEEQWLNGVSSINVAVSRMPHPPLYMSHSPGLYEGITADFLEAMSVTLNKKINIIHFDTLSEALGALDNGEIDVIADYNPSTNPSNKLLFSTPYFMDRNVLLSKNNRPTPIASLKNTKVAYVGDENLGRLIRQTYPDIYLEKHKFYSTAMAALAYGSVDAFWVNASTADYLEMQGIESYTTRRNDDGPGSANMTFAVLPKKMALLNAINTFLHALPEIDRIRIATNWGLDPSYISQFSTLGLSREEQLWLHEHDKILAWLPHNLAPLSFVEADGQPGGFVLSLLKQLSDKIGFQLQVKLSHDTPDALPVAKSGQHAMLVTAIIDRKNSTLRYSHAYAFSPWVLVVNKDVLYGSSLAQFSGKSVAYINNGELLEELKVLNPHVIFVSVPDTETALKMLSSGQVIAAVSPQIITDYLITKQHRSGLTVLDSVDVTPARFAIGFKPGDEMLESIVNKLLMKLSPQTLQRTLFKWQNYQAPAYFSIWKNYSDRVIQGGALLLLFVLLVYLHTRRLKKTLGQRKLYEEQLESKLSFIRTLIDDSPVALYVRDMNLAMVQCNQTYLNFLNVTASEVLGKDILSSPLGRMTSATRLHKIHHRTLTEGEPHYLTSHIEVGNGVCHIYLWSLPYCDHTGDVVGIVGGFIDITERDKLMAELEQARQKAENDNASKSLYLAQMSHEIRTPMNALIGLLELEHRGKSRPDMRKMNIAVAYDAAKSLLTLVGDVLDLAKIESGARQVALEPVDLESLIKATQKLFAKMAENKGLILTVNLEVQNPLVLSDPMMLSQIASNLLSNALKFTQKGGVELALIETFPFDERSEYQLKIRDSGPGLDARQQQIIFEPFVQIGDNPNSLQGTGLGLSICRQLADTLGGRLWVESEAGNGATFIFSFSAGSCSTSAGSCSTSGEPRRITGNFSHAARNILIVDDHKPNRLLMRQQLEYAGHKVTAVESAERALLCVEQARPAFDLVLTDCNMPEMSGFQLVRLLRKREKKMGHGCMPIVGITAMAEQEVRERGLAAGMTDCLFKPIDIDKLLRHVNFEYDDIAEQSRPTIVSLDHLSSSDPLSFRDLAETLIEANRQDLLQLRRVHEQSDANAAGQIIHRMMGGASIANAYSLVSICQELKSGLLNMRNKLFSQAMDRCEKEMLQIEKELMEACTLRESKGNKNEKGERS